MIFSDPLPLEDEVLFRGAHPAEPASAHGETSGLEQRFLGQCLSICLASDLFQASCLGRGRAHKKLFLHTASGSRRVCFTGERLGQDDLDVLLLLTEQAMKTAVAPGDLIRAPVRELIHALGRRTGGQSWKRLESSLHRLESGRLAVHDHRYSYHTRLVSKFFFDHGHQVLLVELDRDLHAAFQSAKGLRTLIHDRLSLDKDALGKWLYSLAWAMAGPFCIESGMLRRMCGEPAGQDDDQGDLIMRALERLADKGLLSLVEKPNSSRLVLAYRTRQDSLGHCPLILSDIQTDEGR